MTVKADASAGHGINAATCDAVAKETTDKSEVTENAMFMQRAGIRKLVQADIAEHRYRASRKLSENAGKFDVHFQRRRCAVNETHTNLSDFPLIAYRNRYKKSREVASPPYSGPSSPTSLKQQ